jgi:hypothetical protein
LSCGPDGGKLLLGQNAPGKLKRGDPVYAYYGFTANRGCIDVSATSRAVV